MELYIGLCISVLLFILIYQVNKRLVVTNYIVQSDRIPDSFSGCKIAFLTDLHSNSHGINNKTLIEAVRKQEPDFIMITGDMIIGEKDFNFNTSLQLIKELSDYPIYYSLGNHEQKLSVYDETKDTTYVEYVEALKKMGVSYLDNEQCFIQKKDDILCITGLTIDMEYYNKVWKQRIMHDDYIESIVEPADKKAYNIVLAHNPQYFNQYSKWGADLVLSGHIHGGIIIFPYIGGMIAPSYRFFPHFDYGIFKQENSTMILSKGLGSHTIKIRINNKPELVIVELKGR